MRVSLFLELHRDKKGQAMVEFALILPLLLFLLMTIFEFGNIFHSYLLVTSASREGARMGVVGQSETEITNRMHEICATLDTTKLEILTAPDLTDPDIAEKVEKGLYRGVSLTVQIKYEVPLITPLLNYILPDPFPIQATSIMRIE